MAWCPDSPRGPCVCPCFREIFIYGWIISSAEYWRRTPGRLGKLFLLSVLSSHGPRASLLPSLHLHTNTVCAAPSALGDTPDYIIGDWGMADPWRGLTGKGFLGKRGGVVHSSIKKTHLRLHLLNWRYLTGLSNWAIVLATVH